MALVSDSLRNFVPNHSRGMKILLVDDDTTSLLHLTKILREFSYNVTPTTSAMCALFLVQEAVENPFQLVMASYNVPDMISLSFLRTMSQKDIPRPAHAPQIEPSPSCAAPFTATTDNTLPMATTELTEQLRRVLLQQDPEDLESRLDPRLVDEYL